MKVVYNHAKTPVQLMSEHLVAKWQERNRIKALKKVKSERINKIKTQTS